MSPEQLIAQANADRQQALEIANAAERRAQQAEAALDALRAEREELRADAAAHPTLRRRLRIALAVCDHTDDACEFFDLVRKLLSSDVPGDATEVLLSDGAVVRVGYSAEDVVGMLRARIQARGDQKRLAKEIGVGQAFLNDVLAGRRRPTGPVLSFLGLQDVVLYQRTSAEGEAQ